jgi:hypothetical protein
MLVPLILQSLPVSTTRLPACALLRRGFQVEPFCGSAASSRSAAVSGGGFGHRPRCVFLELAAGRRRNPQAETPALRRTVFQLSAGQLPVS